MKVRNVASKAKSTVAQAGRWVSGHSKDLLVAGATVALAAVATGLAGSVRRTVLQNPGASTFDEVPNQPPKQQRDTAQPKPNPAPAPRIEVAEKPKAPQTALEQFMAWEHRPSRHLGPHPSVTFADALESGLTGGGVITCLNIYPDRVLVEKGGVVAIDRQRVKKVLEGRFVGGGEITEKELNDTHSALEKWLAEALPMSAKWNSARAG